MGGDDDEAQLEYATRHGLVIVSHNEADFRYWHQTFLDQGRRHSGIILVPEPRGVSPAIRQTRLTIRVAMRVDWIATLADFRGRLFRWGELQLQLE
jgi:hypothetical protein